jgi:methylenetetrahydrofolate dehydrogenase (NADP+)/methenyltetrahydrofolate cyclohydrolase
VTARIIDGKAIAADVRGEVATGVGAIVAAGRRPPHLTAVLVGDDAASATYVRLKERDCAQVGMTSETLALPAATTQDELLDVVRGLNANDGVDGVIVQKPIPGDVDDALIDATLDASKDADGLGPTSLGRLVQGVPVFVPATPAGVQQLLLRSDIDPAGKHVVIVGRSILVGRPLAMLLSAKAAGANATVTIAHTGTPDLGVVTREADIIVAAAGRRNLITADMVQPGAVVIDVGTNRVDDPSKKAGFRLAGDVDFDTVQEIASAITPVPGGVGPMTRAMLLVNTLKAAQARMQ